MTLLQDNGSAYRSVHTLPQRIAGLVFVAALHVVLIYALLNALGVVPMPHIPMPFVGYVIPPETETPLPPPPQIPLIPAPRVSDIPPPPLIVVPFEGSGSNAITSLQPPQPTVLPERQASLVPTLPPPPPLFMPARAIAATHTIPDYPPVSRRLGEQGTLRLRLAITSEGAVSEAQIESSSGHPRLDDAAVQWVKTHWRYEPALEGTKRVPSTAQAVVTFKLY